MNNSSEAFKFIGNNGQVAGVPGLPTLVHLTLGTVKIAAIGTGLALVIALPLQISGVIAGPVTNYIWIPMAAFEITFAVWLLVKGVAAQAR